MKMEGIVVSQGGYHRKQWHGIGSDGSGNWLCQNIIPLTTTHVKS